MCKSPFLAKNKTKKKVEIFFLFPTVGKLLFSQKLINQFECDTLD